MWDPGARVGKFQLVERLGKGGMAETWRGELLAAGGVRKPVVIKRVLPSFSDNKEFIEAFVQEAKITASLSHGNIAQVFDFGQVGDSYFLAMELIDGRSLDRVLKRGISRGYWHMPYPIATLVTLEVAKGLEHVHTRRGPKGPLNIVHRDISPDNIIVGMNGETKLVDFGVAKSVLEGRAETEAGVIKGKYIYFSPEQAAGERVDFRTDIYALGVVFYRLVTGRKAFDGPGLKVLKQIQAGEYLPLRVANPTIPDELATVIESMMATRKESRFDTTLELVEALTSTLQRMAPRAGVHWIRDWTRWLYAEELEKKGEAVELRQGFLELIEQWKPGPKPAPSVEMVSGESKASEQGTVSSRRSPQRKKSTDYEPAPVPAWSFKKKLIAAGVSAFLSSLLVGFVMVFGAHDPSENESDEARNRRLADATRMKPINKEARPLDKSAPEPLEVAEPAGSAAEPAPAEPAPAEPEPAKPDPVAAKTAGEPAPASDAPKEIAYDALTAPVTFMLTSRHQVSLDSAPEMPGSSGSLVNAGPLGSGASSRVGAWSFGDFGNPSGAGAGTKQWTWVNPGAQATTGNRAEGHDVPAWLFAPGKPPQLDLLANGTGRWSRPDTRLALLVGSASEVPQQPLNPTANGKRLLARGAVVVVESQDRFTIDDLSTKQSWKVTVTPKPQPGESVGQVVMFLRGDASLRVDGKPTVGGYAVLGPGSHKVQGAQSGWLTVPTVASLKLAAVSVSFN